MIETFYYYTADRYIGVLTRDSSNGEFIFKQEEFGYLEDIAVSNMSLDCGTSGIKCAISEHIFPENRIDAGELLSLKGLAYYDEWEIYKRNKGICYGNTIWMSDKKDDGKWFWTGHGLGDYVKKDYDRILKEHYSGE